MKVELRSDENPRWACCRAAIGREPLGWEFMIWNGRRWVDYARENGIQRPARIGICDEVFRIGWDKGKTSAEIHAEYNAWLVAAVEAGRFGGLD
jgi:hypothetical protein